MDKVDERELFRLTELLRGIDGKLDQTSAEREGLKKYGIALILVFLRGLRPELEAWCDNMGSPLNEAQRQHLLALGINPDSED